LDFVESVFVFAGTSVISATDLASTTVGTTTLTVAPGTAPAGIVIDPSGKFAFTANRGSNDVSVFKIETNGILTKVGASQATGSDPVSITVAQVSTQLFVYTANNVSNDISAFSVDASTGALTSVPGSPFAAGTGPRSITVTPDGQIVYIINDTSKNVLAYKINASSGALINRTTVVPLTNSTVTALQKPVYISVDATGTFAYIADVDGNKVITYSIGTGSQIGKLTETSAKTESSAFHLTTSGNFAYVSSLNNISSYSITGASGILAKVGSAVSGAWSMAVDQPGKYIYTANYATDTASIFTIGSSGALSNEVTIAAGSQPRYIALDPSSTFAYVVNYKSDDVYVYSINQTTGTLTYVGKSGI
jgi:6-phosphogluconolactonase (cycloisomerase 2 family)